MKIETSQVTKIVISGVDDLDPLHVFLEDFGPARGKITITCFDECWTNFWSAMGAGRTIRDFFLSCDHHYLAGKLATGLKRDVVDTDALEAHALAHIFKLRRAKDIQKDTARDLFDRHQMNDWSLPPEHNSDLMYDIYGDEWWYDLPEKPNHQYVYLCRIVDTVKEALRQAA